MQPGSPRVCPALACAVGASLAVGCAERPKGVDLLRAAPVRLAEASAAGEDAQAVRDEVGQPQRIRNVVRASLPASPPSRYRFVTDVPRQGKLVLDAGIPGRHHGASAVEFLVHVRDRGRETTVVSQLLDPANRPAHRQWVKLEADLSAYARPGVEIVLETRGYEETGTPGRAFWGTPTITVAEDSPQPPGDRLPRRHAARRPPAALRLLPRHRPRALALRRGRGRVRPGDRAVVLDEALGGVALHVAPAPRPRLRAVLHAARPRARHPGREDARSRLHDGRRGREPAGPRQEHALRPGLLVLRGPGRAPARRPGGGRRPRLPRRAEGPADLPLRAHDGRAHALPAPAALRPEVRPAPAAGPRRRRALRLPGAARPRPDRGPVRRGGGLRRPGVRAPPPGPARARPLRPARRSSSCPTTGRSSSTTAAGSTATPSSTSWCACPSS